MSAQNTASGSFSYLLLSEMVRLFEEKYSNHLDKNALVKKKMESIGIKPGFTITAQILRNDFDIIDVNDIASISEIFLIKQLAPLIFNSPQLEAKYKLSKGSTKYSLILKIYQNTLSPFFQILNGGILVRKDSNLSKMAITSSKNFSSSPDINKSPYKRKLSVSHNKKIDSDVVSENEQLEFWQISIAAFYGGAFEGSLIHFGYNTELTDIKVSKETITYVYSIVHMEPPYELPSQFL